MSKQALGFFIAVLFVAFLAFMFTETNKESRCRLALSVAKTKTDSVAYVLAHDCGLFWGDAR